jgi:hypothetical protein
MNETPLNEMAKIATNFIKIIADEALKPVQDSLENLLVRSEKLSYAQLIVEIDKILKNVKEMCE